MTTAEVHFGPIKPTGRAPPSGWLGEWLSHEAVSLVGVSGGRFRSCEGAVSPSTATLSSLNARTEFAIGLVWSSALCISGRPVVCWGDFHIVSLSDRHFHT